MRQWWKTRKTRVRDLVDEYEINTLLLGQIQRIPYPVEVVTFEDEEFAEAVETRLEEYQALVRRVWSTTPTELARIHLKRPDVAVIYDPHPGRAMLTYGAMGRHLTPDNAPKFGAP